MAQQLMAGQFDRPTTEEAPLQQRGSVLPFGQYAGGQTGVAWPGLIAEPVNSFVRLLQDGYQPGTNDVRGVEDAFNVAGAAMTGGLLGRRPAGSIGMSGTPEQPKGITAYHGSPHDFDRFSMEHIGKGEGAQAYGHGLYFAEKEGVARSYRNKLSANTIAIGGVPLGDGPVDAFVKVLYKGNGNDIEAAIREAKSLAEGRRSRGFPELADDADAAVKRLTEVKEGKVSIEDNISGRLYEVRINANPEDFLDWDKPLSQQSEKVLSAIATIEHQAPGRGMRVKDYAETIKAAPQRDATKHLLDDKLINVTGSDLMNMIGTYTGRGNPDSTKVLRDAGIPGIRYLDQGSRTAGEGSRNYVVFDDKLIDILKKYGIVGTAMAGGGMAYPQDKAEAIGLIAGQP